MGRNLNLDCPAHGTGSAWWRSLEQERKRLIESDRIAVLQAVARTMRKGPDALPLRVLACGSRSFADAVRVESVVGTISAVMHKRLVVITGAARGADTLAGTAARRLGLEVIEYPANWTLHGKAAGPIRNQQMLVEGKPHLVVAFDARGSGTSDMVGRARKSDVVICEIRVSDSC